MKNNIVLILGFILILSGCTATQLGIENIQNRANARIKENETRVYKNDASHENEDLTKDIDEFDYHADATSLKAEKIAKAVTGLPFIEHASVVITGNSAIIGIEILGEVDDQTVISYKRQVEKIVKETENTIDHVAVTAGPEMIDRIKDLADFNADSINEPAAPVNEGLENIINGLTPVF